jgi:hypothetical protein
MFLNSWRQLKSTLSRRLTLFKYSNGVNIIRKLIIITCIEFLFSALKFQLPFQMRGVFRFMCTCWLLMEIDLSPLWLLLLSLSRLFEIAEPYRHPARVVGAVVSSTGMTNSGGLRRVWKWRWRTTAVVATPSRFKSLQGPLFLVFVHMVSWKLAATTHVSTNRVSCFVK